MEYIRKGNNIVLRLDKGDEITEQIKLLAKKENISAASITGIGGTDDFTLGVFDVSLKKYNEFTYDTTHEITNITGNITSMNGEVYTHIHMTCAGQNGTAVGGHLLRCVISLTAEIFITVIDVKVDRKRNEELQINTLNF